jgi:protein-tyrosine-phosphatase
VRRMRLVRRVREAMAEVGSDLSNEFPKPFTTDVVEASDVVVTMGCGDACPTCPGKRYLDWDSPISRAVSALRQDSHRVPFSSRLPPRRVGVELVALWSLRGPTTTNDDRKGPKTMGHVSEPLRLFVQVIGGSVRGLIIRRLGCHDSFSPNHEVCADGSSSHRHQQSA